MPTFIEGCNCKGVRPLGVIGSRYTSRPDIIGSMLKDRHVPRFLIASTGFGKSNIAYEYANIIFAFQHVFWIRCDSPCFMRDLDAQGLVKSIFECDPDVELIVCEDLPLLDDDRAFLMSELIDAIIDAGREIIVTCAPPADVFADLQPERIVLRAQDLMITDNELTIEEMRGGVKEDWRTEIWQSERIASTIWDNDGVNRILRGIRAEDLMPEVRLAALILLLAQAGSLDILTRFIRAELLEETLYILERDYPMLGVDAGAKSFAALRVDVADIANAYCPSMDIVVATSLMKDRDKLCVALSDWICDRSSIKRACEVMEAYATKLGAAKWLSQRGWRFLARLEPLPCVRLHDIARRGASGHYDSLSSIKAWGSYLLGDNEQALKFGRRLLRSEGARLQERINIAVLLCLMHDKASIGDAKDLLAGVPKQGFIGVDAKAVYDIVHWNKVADFVNMTTAERSLLLDEAFEAASKEGAGATSEEGIFLNTFLMLVSWLMVEPTLDGSIEDLFRQDGGPDGEEGAEGGQDVMEAFAKAVKLTVRIVETASKKNDLFVMISLKLMDDVCRFMPRLRAVMIDARVDEVVRQKRVALYDQREGYRRLQITDLESKLEFQRTNPDVFRRNETKEPTILAKNVVPMLQVNLFGGLQVRIGDELVNPKMLSRKKTKLLLAMMVINRGRELSKSQILSILWPEGDTDTYKRNFYSVWSQLKKALSFGKSCPYLIRTQSGCRIDARYLRSDISKFDELCRMLLFGTDGQMSWEMLYAQVNEEFSEDLLPSVSDEGKIDALREKYRESLVDGLIATSTRLNRLGEPRGALWFAREAVRRGDKREDAYTALMEAQIAANQRGAALETYFACRKFLSEELGIDPSVRVVELYRSIIETEEVLA